MRYSFHVWNGENMYHLWLTEEKVSPTISLNYNSACLTSHEKNKEYKTVQHVFFSFFFVIPYLSQNIDWQESVGLKPKHRLPPFFFFSYQFIKHE